MGLPTCLETHRFIDPITDDTVGADIIRPYVIPEDSFSVLGANGDEIGTGLAVIIIAKPIRFSLWKFHDVPPL